MILNSCVPMICIIWRGIPIQLICLCILKGNTEEVEAAIGYAIDVGYRLIDTAWCYGTQESIGKVVERKIKDRVIKRKDIFITTKVIYFYSYFTEFCVFISIINSRKNWISVTKWLSYSTHNFRYR